MTITFEDYKYSPMLRSRRAELMGFKHLKPGVKSLVLPMFVLGKWPRSEDIRDSLKKCIDVAGEDAPFVLDITRLAEHRGDASAGFNAHMLVNPQKNFLAWREFLEGFKGQAQIIPTVQFHNDATSRDILQQVLLLERSHGQIAFRVNAAKSRQLEVAMNGLGAMGDPQHALVYVDAGFLTEENYAGAERSIITAINSIRSIDNKINIVILASSFPSSVVSHGDNQGVIPILERRLYRQLGGEKVAIYGDYSSIHPGIGPAAFAYVPRVDFPTPEDWYYFRTRNKVKADGYIESAIYIKGLEAWDPDLEAWGKDEIERVAGGDATKMGAPANWIAVRVNLHITQQALNPPGGYEEDFEDEESEIDDDWAL